MTTVGLKFDNAMGTDRAKSYLILSLLCGIFVAHAIYLAVVAEDAHITFRFARHLAEGNGFVWNLGERPIEGFTTFLWVLVAAGALHAGVNVFWLTQCLGLLAALGTIILTFEIARRHMGASTWIALTPCLFLALSGPLATWATSGMEMTTFGFFLLLGVFGYLAQLRNPSLQWLIASSLSLVVATLLRPEGGMVFVVLAGMAATLFWSRSRKSVGSYLAWSFTYALPLLAFVIWRYLEFGDLVPNTFHQKTGGGFWQHARGVGYVVFFSFFFLQPLAPFPALLAWQVGFPNFRNLMRLQTWVRWANGHEAVALCVALSLAYFAYNIYAGGDYMAMYRFMVPILPFIYLLLVPMLEPVRRSSAGIAHKTAMTTLLVMVAAGATVIHSTPFETSLFRKATWQHGNYRGVQAERRYVARFALIGQFFNDYAGGKSAQLATRSIGAIGYYAKNLAIHDLSGLTDRHIGRIPVKATAQGWAGHEKWDLDYSFNRLPLYFMLDESLAKQDPTQSAPVTALEIADAVERAYPTAQRFVDWIRTHPTFIEQNYKLATVWLDDEVNDERGYFSFLERKGTTSIQVSP